MDFRWVIFIADLDPVVGSEQGKTRPVLVVSDENLNQILPIVNIIPITSRKQGRKIYPNEVLLAQGTGGLEKESIALCHQIRTLDKSRLRKPLRKINDPSLQGEIIEALRFQLGIKIMDVD